jgi:3-oxoacyl-[acyl-carrier-protein] synthase II
MKTKPARRVVVTGLGVVSNVGVDAPSTWNALCNGRSGVSRITCFPQDEQWTVRIAGEIRDWDPGKLIEHNTLKRIDRFCALGMCAAIEAAADCGFDFANGDPLRQGVVIGSGIGGILTIEEGHTRLLAGGPRKISPFTVPRLMVNAAAGNVSIRFNLRGANSSTATACATGAHAIGHAFHFIQRGDAEIMFAGGSEAAISPLCIGSFAAMKALSSRNDDPERASRPFDKDRDGFVLSEGAAVIILEELECARKRGARIYGEIVGFGSSADAYHIAAPDAEGLGARAAMEFALRDAGLNKEQVDYINAHGTSTPLGDAAEIAAVRAVFGSHAQKLAVSSTKSMTDHTLGAAGGLESVATVLAVCNDVLPPTINLENSDVGDDLNLVANTAQQRKTTIALNNSFGFGGHNVSLAFAKYTG